MSYIPPVSGTFTLNGATPVNVALTSMKSTSVVLPTLKTVGGVQALAPAIVVSAGVGFAATGIAGDTSIYNYTVLL